MHGWKAFAAAQRAVKSGRPFLNEEMQFEFHREVEELQLDLSTPKGSKQGGDTPRNDMVIENNGDDGGKNEGGDEEIEEIEAEPDLVVADADGNL